MSKICVNCGMAAELLCARCQDPYCSRQCQRSDWALHRSICFNIPPLVRDMSSFDLESTQNAIEMGIVEPFEKKSLPPNKVDLKTTEADEPKQKVQGEVARPLIAKELNSNRLPIDHQAAITQKPKEIEKKSVPAVIDNEKKSTKAIQQEEEKVSSAPIMLHSAIETVQQKKPNDLEKPVPKKQLPLKLPMSGRGMPSMKLPEKKPDQPKKEEAKKLLMMSELKVRSWPDSKNIRVKILGVIENNIITLLEDKEEVQSYHDFIEKEIACICKDYDKSEYKPIVGEVVFAKYENAWCRANVLEVSAEKTIVQHIDYGSFDELAPGTMFPAPQAKFEICSRDFHIDNMPEELTGKQFEIIKSGSFTITNVRKEEGVYHCSIFGF